MEVITQPRIKVSLKVGNMFKDNTKVISHVKTIPKWSNLIITLVLRRSQS